MKKKVKVELFIDEDGNLYVKKPDGTELVLGGQCGLGSPVWVTAIQETSDA